MTVTNEARYSYLVQDVTIHEVTERKIRRFGEFEKGWHYGEGVSFEQSVLDNAIAMNQEAIRLGFYETDAFPGLSGEVMVTVYSSDHDLDFIFERDDSVTFCHEEGDKEICHEQGLSFQDAKVRIAEFRKNTWRQFGSSVDGITAASGADSRVLPSVTAQTTREFL